MSPSRCLRRSSSLNLGSDVEKTDAIPFVFSATLDGYMWKTLRSRVFAFLSFLMMVSLAGVGVSFWITQNLNARITDVNLRFLPFQKNLIQLNVQTDDLRREMERSLGSSHWGNAFWKPKRIPSWAWESHRTALNRFNQIDLTASGWREWHERMQNWSNQAEQLAEKFYLTLQDEPAEHALPLQEQWLKILESMQKEIDWARHHIEDETRLAFQKAQDEVKDLRFALQILLLVVISVALLMLWMGERALRPIDHLRKMVKQITERGALTSEEKAELPRASLMHKDEVSELAREFHQMAVSLLEREKMIESQKDRLEEQNKMLLQMSELQKRLQEAEHLAGIGRLSAQVAHEVGNPLHSIGLEAELAIDLLQESQLKDHQSSKTIHLRQSIQSILASVERLKKITQNYLRISKGNVQMQKVNISEIIEAALATYANSIQQAGARVRWFYPENFQGQDQLVVHVDANLLEQAFGNLIRNSLQAMEGTGREGRIDIQISLTADSRLMIQFFDNGKGVQVADRENIFKPFFTTKADGTGLGLSFVKKVFTDLGGTFALRDSSGEGTLFEGVLPLAMASRMAENEVFS
jgi:signal transduction histidine kinase